MNFVRVWIMVAYAALISPWLMFASTGDDFYAVLGAICGAVGIALLPKAMRDWA